MDNDIQFSNMDSWRGSSSNKFGLTFKQIVLMHINRCVVNGSDEMHGGYWQERSKSMGGVSSIERYYIKNSREVHNNSIKMLRALLRGYFDKEMTEADTKLQEEIQAVVQEGEEVDDKKKFAKIRQKKIDLHRELFEELVMLSKRLNFFEEETSEEEL